MAIPRLRCAHGARLNLSMLSSPTVNDGGLTAADCEDENVEEECDDDDDDDEEEEENDALNE
eukprot:8683138-Pyramimonas_sp.AAC.2